MINIPELIMFLGLTVVALCTILTTGNFERAKSGFSQGCITILLKLFSAWWFVKGASENLKLELRKKISLKLISAQSAKLNKDGKKTKTTKD